MRVTLCGEGKCGFSISVLPFFIWIFGFVIRGYSFRNGNGYVVLVIALQLSQHHKVYAVDIVPAKVDMVNQRKSPIQDEYIEKYLAEKDLNSTATLDAEMAYSAADFVVIAAPTNVCPKFLVA